MHLDLLSKKKGKEVENENEKSVSGDWLEIRLIKRYFDH